MPLTQLATDFTLSAEEAAVRWRLENALYYPDSRCKYNLWRFVFCMADGSCSDLADDPGVRPWVNLWLIPLLWGDYS